MTIDRQDADVIAAAIRRANRPPAHWDGAHDPHSFDDMDDLVDPDDPEDRAAFARTREGIAERHLGELIAEQDVRHGGHDDAADRLLLKFSVLMESKALSGLRSS